MCIRSAAKSSLLLWLLCGVLVTPLAAADRTFVGLLALAVEDEVARELELSDETRQELQELAAEREDAAIELALAIKALPEQEREARLAAFVSESEQKGFQLLTDQQVGRIKQIRIARDGAATLAEAEIADQVKLTDEQRAQVSQLIQERSEALTRGGEEDRRIVRATFEQKLMSVIDQQQRAAWERLAGLAAVEPGATAGEAETPMVAGAESEVQPEPEPGDGPVGEGDGTPVPAAGETEPAVASATEEGAEDAGDAAMPTPVAAPADPKDVRLKFSFRFAPWKDVLEWFATQADLSLVLDAPPAGTFNYTDSRTYTPAQAIDLLNSVLLTKGYTLIRHERMLMLINLEDGIPPNLVTSVPLEKLDDVGEFELVSCLFQLDKMSPTDAEAEISKLLGPQGSVVSLPNAQQILVTETGNRLRTIKRVIERIEKPQVEEDRAVVTMLLKHVTADEVLVVARQLLGLPEDQNAAPDGAIRIAVDPLGTKLFVTGDEKTVARFQDIMRLVDVPADFDVGEGSLAEPPQLEVYSVTDADPASVLQVMQTLMSGLPDVRLASDPKTGNLVVLARPSQHATIKATLDQMQRDASQVEVIRLRVVDPQLAVLSINKLFGAGAEGDGGRNAPMVDADPITRQLLLRGTQNQIEQIRTLLEKMGETDSDIAALDETRGGNVRMLPITGSTADAVLQQVQQVWPAMHRNQIRVVTPSRSIQAIRPGGRPADDLGLPFTPDGELDLSPLMNLPKTDRPNRAQPDGAAKPGGAAESPETRTEPSEPASPAASPSSAMRDESEAATSGVSGDRSAMRRFPKTEWFQFAALQDAEGAEVTPSGPPAAGDTAAAAANSAKLPPEVVISVGPGGIMIASEDLDALDDLETLINSLADRMAAAGERFTVFYLKYARADVASQLLEEVLGGGSADTGGGGGSLLGDLAGGMLGGGGGGLMGTLLGLGGGDDGGGFLETTGAVTIVPDLRLNALIVEANPTDVDLIAQLLKVIDQEGSPEKVETIAAPKLIPVYYTNAQEVANVVRQVFAQQISNSGSGGQRQPSPEEFIRALRGGGRGRDSQSNRSQQEQQMMTVGVDDRSNSLVVSAPEPLLRQVEQLVEQLDQAGVESEQTMRVVSIQRADPAVVSQALSSLLGQARSSTTSRTPTSSSGPAPAAGGSSTTGSSGADQMRERMMMFNALRNSGSAQPSVPGRGPGGPSRGMGGPSRGGFGTSRGR